jgi:hypothetical protein
MRKSLTRSSAFLVFMTMSLVCSARISEDKLRRYVTEHPKWRDEGSRELVGLFHLYLVVPEMGIKETQKLTPCS